MPNDFIYCLANNYFILTQNHVSILRSLHQLVDQISGFYMERRQGGTSTCKRESLSLGQGRFRDTLCVIISHTVLGDNLWPRI